MVEQEVDAIFMEALRTASHDIAALPHEWTGVERVVRRTVATSETTTYTEEEHRATVQRDGDLVVGVFSDSELTFAVRIGGQDCTGAGGGGAVPRGGGYVPMKVPMICWHYSLMHIVCDRPAELTVVYGIILDAPIRRALAQRGAFQRLPNGRLLVYKGHVCECESDKYDTSSMVELTMAPALG
jgi:hypothetical protein